MIPGRFLLLLCIACTCAIPAAAGRPGLKIGCWNLQNFLVGNRFENGRFLYKYPMPESRKSDIRMMICRQDPDILFLQEIGSYGFLLELQRDLMASGLHFPFYHFSGFPDARSGLAVLSKIPTLEVVFHDLSLRRGVQEVRLRVDAETFRFFHVHLKSRFSEDPSDPQATRFREQEIRILAASLQRFLQTDSCSSLLLLGDFNTPFDDPLLLPLHRSWSPVPLADQKGNPNTYFHHSGKVERLDGFWIPATSPLRPAGSLLPLPDRSPSDHRFLLLHLPPPS